MKPPQGAAIDEGGVWRQVLRPADWDQPRPALFLDRDGVIIEDRHYIHKVEDVFLIAGATLVIRRANKLGVPVIVVTNQAGIARGYFGWEEFAAVQALTQQLLAEGGAYLDGVYACPHHPKGDTEYSRPDSECRKPAPGMLRRAAEDFPIDMAASWIIGDRVGDLGAGKNAGLRGGMHLLTGHGSEPGQRDDCLALADGDYTVLTGESVADALGAIPLL